MIKYTLLFILIIAIVLLLLPSIINYRLSGYFGSSSSDKSNVLRSGN